MYSTEYIDCYQNGNKLQRIRVFKIYSMHRFEAFFFIRHRIAYDLEENIKRSIFSGQAAEVLRSKWKRGGNYKQSFAADVLIIEAYK